jgi:hypothetical protein
MKPDFHQLMDTGKSASLGPETRQGRKSIAELDTMLATQFSASKLDASKLNLIRAVVLLWHDHLDEAHEIAQQDNGPDGSLIHAIMHRREPDFGNAKYWYHRTGRHAVYPEFARRAVVLPESEQEKDLVLRFTPKDEWDPFAFVDAVQRSRIDAPETGPFLQRAQKMEFEALLDYLENVP